MKTLALFAALVALPALAGEKAIGIITSPDGTERSNGSTAAPFLVPQGAKLTFNCTAAVSVCVDTNSACVAPGAGSNFGVSVAASANFPTSVDPVQRIFITIGTDRSSVIRAVGSAAFVCYVWVRTGNE